MHVNLPQNNSFEEILSYFRKANVIKEKIYEVALFYSPHSYMRMGLITFVISHISSLKSSNNLEEEGA